MENESESDDYKTLTTVGPIDEAAGGRRPYLVVISGPDAGGQTFPLEGESLIVGRAHDATIRINDPGISRHHARLIVRNSHVELLDLGSKNGTFIDGERVESFVLEDGQKFQIGSTTVLKVIWQDEIEEAFQQQLYDSSVRDPLTGIYNRRFLIEVLQKDVSYCLRHQCALTLVMLDVDHFKRVNDTHGHLAGDEVLKRLAQRLQESIRGEDVLARYGGEEFAIVLRECSLAPGHFFAERVRASIEQLKVEFSGVRIPVTVSIGLAALNAEELNTPEALLAAADKNLYRAKEGGRNQVVSGTEDTR